MSGRLLDVNALIAWEHRGSPHHDRFHSWVKRVGSKTLWTCALAELGFIRVSMQVFGYSLAETMTALEEIRKHTGGFVDSAPSPELADWVTSPAHTSDAYLAQIARTNGLQLATLDAGIPDSVAELIS